MSEPPDMAANLLEPECYPDSPSAIELVQNPTSYVFLTGEYAYKIKRPVDPGYLDYTTLEKRRFYCNREVMLNRRLCPDIYLDTVPVTRDKNGFSVEGRGKAVEYAVKMRQLPRDKMLDSLLTEGSVPDSAMTGIALKISSFHEHAATSDIISDYGDLEFILTHTEDNFIGTIRYLSKTISQKSYRFIKDYTNSFMEHNTALFYERIADAKIRDCHGDIRAEHICVNDDVYIYDCIEFNDSLRYCDVASDIAVLLVDLDDHGRSDLARSFTDAYLDYSNDDDLPKILDFYKCYRAYDLGRYESMKLEVPDITEEEKETVTTVAGKYFELAESYI